MVPPFYSSPFLHGAQPSYLIAIFGEGIVEGDVIFSNPRGSYRELSWQAVHELA
jgi:hypothetical protein